MLMALEQFTNVYKDLFNSVDDREGIQELQKRLKDWGINSSDVDLITPDVVKRAIKNLKPGKPDVSGKFTSEAFLNGPENLCNALSVLFKSFFIHNDFTSSILACAFMPLKKGVLKDDTKSDNYLAIAISSLILKVFDNVILILFGHFLGTDWLQFGFKPKTGTTQCSWFVLEVVAYYKQQKTSVKSALLDCSKAFDKCVFSVLFGKCLARGIPPIFVPGLLCIYQKQRCWVRWSNGLTSKDFGISNGTRQGS